jgi:hypothetical protein
MSIKVQNIPTLYKPRGAVSLPDNRDWTNRFEIRSETSDRIYIIAQHINHRHWGCSCPAWKIRRSCKHLKTVGLPTGEVPYEVNLK